MGRGATKAAGNVWYEARMDAAKWNDKLSSRAGAAEALNMSEDAVKDAELVAEALRMAASAKEDHDRMIHLRGVLSQLAWRAAEANRASEEDRPRKMQAVLGELLSAARMQGLIRDEGGDFK